MNIALTQDRTAEVISMVVQPLNHRAMLARLNIQCPTFRKTDRRIARKVAEETGGDPAMHTHSRLLLAKAAIKDIQTIISEAQTLHRLNTSPWEDEGERILSSMRFPIYVPLIRELERRYNEAVDKFIPVYPSLIEEARPLLGDAFNEADYPDPKDIHKKFSFRFKIYELHTAHDFRCPSIGEDEQERIRAEIEERTQEALRGVVSDLYKQAKKHVDHMVERLKEYEEREARREQAGGKLTDRDGIFRDTLVDNIKEYVERLPGLNLTGDPEVETLRQSLLRQLCAHSAEDLRKSPLTRQHVLQQAETIGAALLDKVATIETTVSDLI